MKVLYKQKFENPFLKIDFEYDYIHSFLCIYQARSQVGARTGNARPGKFFARPNLTDKIK